MIINSINWLANKLIEFGVFAPLWQLQVILILGAGAALILVIRRLPAVPLHWPHFRLPRIHRKRVLHIEVISV